MIPKDLNLAKQLHEKMLDDSLGADLQVSLPDNDNIRNLSKREYFAAMAMQGILAGGKPLMILGKEWSIDGGAILIADALIAELNK